jgi:hypothetical protein
MKTPRYTSFGHHSASILHLKDGYESVQGLQKERENGEKEEVKKIAAREI